jgi:hypothetical protein
VKLRFCDEFDHGFGWLAEDELLQRASHAVLAGGRVWVTDAVHGPEIEERIRALGEPAGVVQLLDRHSRDCGAVARRLGVPLHVTPFGGVPNAPFEVIAVSGMGSSREVALYFSQERVLVCGDALGSVGYFRAGSEPFGVHPLRRLVPPRRAFGGLEPEHLLFGHGAGVHGAEAAHSLREALATARRRLPRALAGALAGAVRGQRGR